MIKNSLIIDTDPGCDDVLALLQAFSSSNQNVEIALISVTYGNISAKGCLQNVVSTFHVIDKEIKWRQSHGLPEGFEMLKRRSKPMVAVGADEPLGGEKMAADYFHGVDGLRGVHTSHPQHSSPLETWQHLFDPMPPNPPTDDPIVVAATEATHSNPPTDATGHLFTPSRKHAVDEILDLLASSPIDSVTLAAIGPLTNFALAALKNPITFLRAKSVVAMSGAVDVPGNITPVGEFNCIADPLAAAIVYCLSSPHPSSTAPLLPPCKARDDVNSMLQKLHTSHESTPRRRRLRFELFPLDLTTSYTLPWSMCHAATEPLIRQGSPLAEWVAVFVSSLIRNIVSLHLDFNESVHHSPSHTEKMEQEMERGSMALHDPLAVYYALAVAASSNDQELADAGWRFTQDEDIRVEVLGQWTRGMCVVDRRRRKKILNTSADSNTMKAEDLDAEEDRDRGGWLHSSKGNRVRRCTGTPGDVNGRGYDFLAEELLHVVFGTQYS